MKKKFPFGFPPAPPPDLEDNKTKTATEAFLRAEAAARIPEEMIRRLLAESREIQAIRSRHRDLRDRVEAMDQGHFTLDQRLADLEQRFDDFVERYSRAGGRRNE